MDAAAEARLKVKSGAQWLDDQIDGWRERVDVATLAMDSGCRCVLAQATGQGFDGAVRSWSLSSDEAAALGFDLDLEEWFSTEVANAWARLETAWREELARG